MRKSVLLLFLFAIMLSCNSKYSDTDFKPEVIEIDIDDKNRAQLIVSEVDVIPLETSENCLIGFFGEAKYFNDQIYVLNNNRFIQPTLFVFDDRGNFIRKTIIGKGPGEVIEPFAFAINKEDSTIILHDQAQNPTFVFDLDLNFIRKIKHDYIFNSNFTHIRRDTFLIAHHIPKDRNNNPGEGEYYTYTLYTEEFTKAKHLDILVKGNQRISLHASVSVINNEALFVAPYNYNIYQDGKIYKNIN